MSHNNVFSFTWLLLTTLLTDHMFQVLVLEAGEEENIDYDIPGVPTKEFRPILWNYRTERNGFSCLSRPGGSCEVKTGKALGGSSVVNDMKYTRGSKKDYDAWHSNGEIGSLEWKFENLVEHFKVSEDNGEFFIHSSLASRWQLPMKSITLCCLHTKKESIVRPLLKYHRL